MRLSAPWSTHRSSNSHCASSRRAAGGAPFREWRRFAVDSSPRLGVDAIWLMANSASGKSLSQSSVCDPGAVPKAQVGNRRRSTLRRRGGGIHLAGRRVQREEHKSRLGAEPPRNPPERWLQRWPPPQTGHGRPQAQRAPSRLGQNARRLCTIARISKICGGQFRSAAARLRLS